MSENLPGVSGEEGAGKPLTKAEFAKRERERKALQLWIDGRSYTQIKNALNLRNTDAARELVRKGEERWEAEERGALVRHVAAQVGRMYEIIGESRRGDLVRDREGNPVTGADGQEVREINWSAVDREMKAWDRLSKLLGLDAEKDVGTGPNVLVIDTRPPWEREAPIEGEGEEVNPPGLPEGS